MAVDFAHDPLPEPHVTFRTLFPEFGADLADLNARIANRAVCVGCTAPGPWLDWWCPPCQQQLAAPRPQRWAAEAVFAALRRGL